MSRCCAQACLGQSAQESAALVCFAHRNGDVVELRQALTELWIIDVQHEWKALTADFIGDGEDPIIIVVDIDPHRFVKMRSRPIAHLHGCVNRAQKETDPKLVVTRTQFGVSAHQKRESLSVSKLVIAPFLKPLEDRVEVVIRVTSPI